MVKRRRGAAADSEARLCLSSLIVPRPENGDETAGLAPVTRKRRVKVPAHADAVPRVKSGLAFGLRRWLGGRFRDGGVYTLHDLVEVVEVVGV